jgi:hypothetical protein
MAHQLVMNKRATPPPVKYAKKSPVNHPKEMSLADKRMVEFMNYVCNNGVTVMIDGELKVIDHWGKFVEAIGLKREGMDQIRAGKASFRQHHFIKLSERFNADMNFFFKKDHTQMFLEQKESVKDQFLKIAARVVRELEKV